MPWIFFGTPGVLVLDDDPSVPAKIQGILGDDFRVFGATSMDAAVSHLEREAIGVVISDTRVRDNAVVRSEEHTSELQSLMRISYAVFCLKKKNTIPTTPTIC